MDGLQLVMSPEFALIEVVALLKLPDEIDDGRHGTRHSMTDEHCVHAAEQNVGEEPEHRGPRHIGKQVCQLHTRHHHLGALVEQRIDLRQFTPNEQGGDAEEQKTTADDEVAIADLVRWLGKKVLETTSASARA